MNLNEILHGRDCACGKRHSCPIEKVYVEKGAAKRLGELCPENNILLIADENTFRAGGERVLTNLAEKNIRKLVFCGDRLLIPNEEAISAVEDNLDGTELIIALGSGVIQDLSKYVSHKHKIPYIDMATAPSMDGYASDGAAMILGGMKETVKAGLPRAIVADTEILKDAPFEMLQAGYGDIIGKYSALCDWRLSHLVNGEYYCDYVATTVEEMIEKTVSLAKGITERDEESVGALMEALVAVGIMMSFAGSSRPASGSEHHLSHYFEIVGIIKNEDYFAHGIDVAYSTVITASIREKLVNTPFTCELFRLKRELYEAKMEKLYAGVAKSCIALQDKIGNYAKDRTGVYLDREEEIKKILSAPPSASETEKLLALVGLDMSCFYSKYGTEKIKNAVSYAKDLKDRYTVLWLNYDLFGEEK